MKESEPELTPFESAISHITRKLLDEFTPSEMGQILTQVKDRISQDYELRLENLHKNAEEIDGMFKQFKEAVC